MSLCVLTSFAGVGSSYAWPSDQDQPTPPRQPRLGAPPSLTPDQVRRLTTSTLAPITPRAPGQSRAEVVSLFNTQYTPALGIPVGWTGSVAGCVPGVTSQAFEAATIKMANYFRTMAGLPTVTLDPARTPGAQAAALIMKAQGDLSHDPPPTWACWTQAGRDSAAKSNLFLGQTGAEAVAGYVNDAGVANLGHRRWIIYPPQVQIGTGSTDSTNALDVIGGFGQRPATPEYVAWPPPGFVPYQVVYNTWSFANPNAEFANAFVTMTFQGAPIQLNLVQLPNGFGDNAISWIPQGLGTGAGVADRSFTVTVNNVVIGGTPRTFSYDVTVIDPAITPPNQPVSCNPRPRPTVTSVSGGPGRIVTTISVTGANNTLTSIRFGNGNRSIVNATVDVQGQATGVTAGQTVNLPTSATQAVLTVTRIGAGQAVLVPLVAVDGCGEWPSFVGMGVGAP
jgi:uncharacterized protein YkwD